jgi:hypothetical protein
LRVPTLNAGDLSLNAFGGKSSIFLGGDIVKKIISAVIRPTKHQRKIYLRVLSLMTVVFICAMSVSLAFVASAGTAWTYKSVPDWKAYEFTSAAEYQKALTQGVRPQDWECRMVGSDGYSYTNSYPHLYQVYKYNSQADFETAIDGGKTYTDDYVNSGANTDSTDTSKSWYMGLGVGGASLSEYMTELENPEVTIPVVTAAIGAGVVFKNKDQIKNFYSGWLTYLDTIETTVHHQNADKR